MSRISSSMRSHAAPRDGRTVLPRPGRVNPRYPARVNRGFAYEEQVDRRAAGHTVLDHLAARHTHSDRSEWAARLARGEVRLEDRVASGGEVLGPGQRLVWHR